MPEERSQLNLDRSIFPVDRYEPLELLGKGALGEVYLARDKTLGRVVAVKCLITVDNEQVVAFHREARIASRLSHANIIGSLDFGTTDNGRPYLALEYFDGISLETFLEQQKHLSEERVAGIFVMVARALGYIHDHDIFHRDLKPSNILLKVSGNEVVDLRIIDFGLSSIKEEFQTKTLMQGRTLVGTPLYMSPDQVSGGVYDARSEVYSLGCLMFEALTGSPPFPGESSMVILEHHLNTDPPLLQEVRPDKEFSLGIQRIVRKCLEKKKENRFQTMNDVVDALEQIDTFNETYGGEGKREARRTGYFALIACLVLSLAAVAAIAVITLNDSSESKARIKKVKLESNSFAILDEPGAPTSFLSQAEHVQGSDGVYFWGIESIERLKTLSKSGTHKSILTLRGMPLTTAIVDLLIPITPTLVQIHHCPFQSPDLMRHLAANRAIVVLGFHECEITADDVEELKSMPNLRSLIMEDCHITDAHMAAMAKLHQVNRFSLDGNEAITLNGVKHLSRKDRPVAVWVNAGQLTDVPREDIQELKKDHNIMLITKDMQTIDNLDRDAIFR